MTFAEKLKETRRQAGLSQEQLADKLCVSRQAVTKWETGKGMPDIENIRAIAKLLNVSIDYLLDDQESMDNSVIREQITLNDYQKSGKCRSLEDACVLAKYPDAQEIHALARKKKLTMVENVLDFLVQPNIFTVADGFADMSCYYLVQTAAGQFFVNVTKEFITSTRMNKTITDRKFVIGQNQYTKLYRIL